MAYGTDSENPFPPVRKVPRKATCYRGYHSSFAMMDQLRYESRSVEKKLMWVLDFLFELGLVKSIHPQPFRIEYRPGRYYHPDVLVTFRLRSQKPWLIEGKGGSFDKKKLHADKEKYRAAIGLGFEKGFIFHFVTSAQLSLINDDILPFLQTHRGKHVPNEVYKAVLTVLRRRGPLLPRDITSYCRNDYSIFVTIEQIWRLAADGKIFCDLRNNQYKAVVAAPVCIKNLPIRKNILFGLPLILGGDKHD
jgi:hypothetical protein